MRGKRSKQYRKLMQQYGMTFGFREPFQVLRSYPNIGQHGRRVVNIVLVDAGIIQDAARFKMDLVGGLKRTLHGEVKPMITQCSMRHLYNDSSLDSALVDEVKTYERRRCNHHMLDKPLSTLECLSGVVDPKSNSTNKHRYVIASQDGEARAFMRNVAGVPLVYISRSVMIMEPMADATERVRECEERGKLRAGLKDKRGEQVGVKRKRDLGGENASERERNEEDTSRGVPKRRKPGAKGPNPLSVKKPKRRSTGQAQTATNETRGSRGADQQSEIGLKKRKRKHRSVRSERPVTGAVEERPMGQDHYVLPNS
ncbi:MAG: hypothetical protein M1840_003422 [Geoglossum simile]|nr:MAG: hypothetical protein M1840_003422 [Geoglossum simile]